MSGNHNEQHSTPPKTQAQASTQPERAEEGCQSTPPDGTPAAHNTGHKYEDVWGSWPKREDVNPDERED